MAKQERAIRTRKIILRAAGEVFDEQGYEASTISDILARAQVTKGALYFHFRSKEELARGVLDEQARLIAIAPQALKLQELVDMAMGVGARLNDDPLLRGSVRLTIEQGARSLGTQSGPYVAWTEVAVGILEAARGQGELLPHVVPVDTAELIVGAFAGIQLMSQTMSDRTDLGRRLSVFLDHILPSVAVPGILSRLDTAPDRGARILTRFGQAEEAEAEPVTV